MNNGHYSSRGRPCQGELRVLETIGCGASSRETLNKSFISRVAGKIAMIAGRATKVVAGTTMPRSATMRARNFAATRMGTGFAGGLLRCAPCEGGQPFASPHALHPDPQNRVRGYAGLIQCFPRCASSYKMRYCSRQSSQIHSLCRYFTAVRPPPAFCSSRRLPWGMCCTTFPL
jgi:hypothetical protein